MTVRAVTLAAAGSILVLVASGCREERDSGGAAGQGERSAGDASVVSAGRGKQAPRRPETAVLSGVAIRRVDPAHPRPIRDEELSARLGQVLTSSTAFVAEAGKVPAGRTAVPVSVAVTLRYDVARAPPGQGARSGRKRTAMIAVVAEMDWKAEGDRLQARENVLIERPIERRDEARLDQLMVELAIQSVELAGAGLVEKETLRQADDSRVLAALQSDDSDPVLWALELCAERRLAGAFDRAVALLDASDPGVQAAALRVLVALRDPRAVRSLARRADFADPETMRSLVEAVTAIGGPEAIEFLELVAGGHDEADLRDRAREGLERLGRRKPPNP